MQNLPKKQEPEFKRILSLDGVLDPRYAPIKSVCVADTGYVLVEADYNQAELWTMAGLAHDDEMLHVLETSDLHTETTIAMFAGKPYGSGVIGDMTAEEYNERRKEDKDLDSKRVAGKSVVFGIPSNQAVIW